MRFTPQDRIGVERETYMLTGAVAPDLARERRINREGRVVVDERGYVSTLIAHGHLAAVVDHLLQCDRAESYSYGATAAVINAHPDEAVKLSLVQKAIRIWFECQSNPNVVSVRHRMRAHEFNRLLAVHWRLLSSDEALRVTRALVSAIAQGEDDPIEAPFDPEERMTFTSGLQHSLFELLHILRHVDPELADLLTPQYLELATAAALFPFGYESVHEASEARRPVLKAGEQDTNKLRGDWRRR